MKYLRIKMRSKEGFEHDVRIVMLHTSFAVSSEGTPLGILNTQLTYDKICAKRGQTETCMQGMNKTILIDEKARHCWTQAFEKCKPTYRDFNDQVLHGVDRERDIYELLQLALNEKTPFLVRSSANRRTDVGRV